MDRNSISKQIFKSQVESFVSTSKEMDENSIKKSIYCTTIDPPSASISETTSLDLKPQQNHQCCFPSFYWFAVCSSLFNVHLNQFKKSQQETENIVYCWISCNHEYRNERKFYQQTYIRAYSWIVACKTCSIGIDGNIFRKYTCCSTIDCPTRIASNNYQFTSHSLTNA